jgi:hypothetical protein
MQVDDPNDPHVLEELAKALGGTPVRHRNWYLRSSASALTACASSKSKCEAKKHKLRNTWRGPQPQPKGGNLLAHPR